MFNDLRHALIPLESESYKGLEGTFQTGDSLIMNIFLDMDDMRTIMPTDPNVYEYQPKLVLDTQLTFAAYTIGAGAFWGSFLFVFFAGTGLVAIPFTHIIAWADRPVAMNESEFKKKKDGLVK